LKRELVDEHRFPNQVEVVRFAVRSWSNKGALFEPLVAIPFEHPENQYRLCVHGARHAEAVWFPVPFPVAHLPPLLLIGLFTRPVALILSGEKAVAYFKFHAPQGFWLLLNDGEGAVLYCIIFL